MVPLPPPSVPIFDPHRIPDFIEPNDRRTLLQLFLNTSTESLQKLKEELGHSPWSKPSLKHTLHGLKGAAVSVGASGLAQAAKEAESGLEQWDRDEVAKAIIDLETLLFKTQIAMEPWLK
jgi:HPt (histidine-containing phosphotransfer) domain-containing protein